MQPEQDERVITPTPTTADVRAFWERNPVAAAAIASPPGSREFFEAFDRLRLAVEPAWVQEEIYAFDRFRGKRVLDVGCGNGYVLSRCARHGARTFGIDLTQAAVELSRKRFALAGLKGDFVQADAERLPFRDGMFERVVSVGVLHHIPSIELAIAEIHRVLTPGGSFALMLYHRNSLHYRLLYPLYGVLHPQFRGHRPPDVARRIDGADNPIGRVFSRRQVRHLLKAFGRVELRVRSLPIRPLLRVPGGVPLLDLFSRWLGWFLYARAVK
jgi:ubiquinone/menaquinone biosynthesis C-methylase UbiE